jgi:hypothetical protein
VNEIWPYLEQFVRPGELDWPPQLRVTDIRFEQLSQDYSRISVPSGFIAAAIEAGARQALATTLRNDYDAVAIHVDTKSISPLPTGRVFAEALVTHKGRHLAHVDVAVSDEAGTTVARGWCVFSLVHRESPVADLAITSDSTCAVFDGGAGT